MPQDYIPPTDLHDSYWMRQTPIIQESTTSLQQHPECDYLIIGAGLSGVSMAYSLIKSCKTASVILLDARGICTSATGRKGGHLRPDLYEQIPKYIERHGLDEGAGWAEFEIANAEAIKKVIREENIDCGLTETKSTDCYLNEDDEAACSRLVGNQNLELTRRPAAERIRDVYQDLMATKRACFDHIQFAYGSEKNAALGVKHVKASITYAASALDPYKFVLDLLNRAITAAGGRLSVHPDTPALAVRQSTRDDTWEVETPRGSIRAKKVIHANNAYVAGLLPEYSKCIIPCKGLCTYISVSEDNPGPPELDRLYVIRDRDNVLSYLVPIEGGRKGVVVGGASRMFRADRSEWYNTVDDTRVIASGERYFQEEFLSRTFKGWEDSRASVQDVWTGVMGYSADSLPHIGEVPRKPGQFIVAGFNGHGMPVIWLAAQGLAEMVSTGKSYEDVGYLPGIAKTTLERISSVAERPDGGDIF